MIKLGHAIALQMKLFPATVCPCYCPPCGIITTHYWGKANPDAPEKLICNECGWNAAINPSMRES